MSTPESQNPPRTPPPTIEEALAGKSGSSLPAQDDVADIKGKRDKWRQDRLHHEPLWFLSTAFVRGNHYTEWDDVSSQLVRIKSAPTRVRLTINRLQAKARARLAKFTKNRPRILVTPGTSEYKDYLNAKATQKYCDYQYKRLGFENKYKRAVLWARECSRGFIWLHWNPNAPARVIEKAPDGSNVYRELDLGDIEIEVGSPYEVLVSDPSCQNIAEQPEIMRIKLQLVTDMKARYPEAAESIEGDAASEDLFRYEQMTASTSSKGYAGDGKKKAGDKKYTLVTERFIRPGGERPEGRYQVMVGEVIVKDEGLPYGFHDMENPYPVVSYADMETAGQFWGPTVTEQMIDLSREYNLVRSKLSEHMRVLAFPKLFVAMQHQLAPGAWSADAGQFIEYVAHPDIAPPTPWVPPPISQDVWQLVTTLQKEFDDVSQIFPSVEGKPGGATSGFQTNLLQEASESVHAPDIRAHELQTEDLFRKIRRMTQQYYQVPRLLAIVGTNFEPEVLEFSGQMIDEYADLSVEAGSALPTFKAARQDTVMNMYNSGLLGDPADPEVRRRALTLLELGSVEEAFDRARTDENQAKRDLQVLTDLRQDPRIVDPHAWDNHKIHYNVKTDWLKSPEGQAAHPAVQRAVVRNVILHARYIDANSALKVALQEQMDPDVIQTIYKEMIPPPPPPGMVPPPGLLMGPGGPTVPGAGPGQPPPPPAPPGPPPAR